MSVASIAYEPRHLTFHVSRGVEGAFVVKEERDRIGGLFTAMSDAIAFAQREGVYRKRAVELKFDESLAFIRAAG